MPLAESPVARDTMPESPADPAVAVCTLTIPDAPLALPPLLMMTEPPDADDADHPADRARLPDVPESLDPTTTLIPPLRPLVLAPVLARIHPLFPLADAPVSIR